MEDTPKIHSETFLVHSYEIDPTNRVTVPVICNFLQDAAGQHARELGVSVDQLLPHNLTWVLAQLRVRLHEFPTWGDTIRIETWPAEVSRLHAYRDFRLFLAEREIGVAATAWLLIDFEKKRPARMPDFIRAMHPGEPVRVFADGFSTLVAPQPGGPMRHFPVRFSDLDLNWHANNVSFIEWVAESLAEEFWRTHRLQELEIHYRQESRFGETVVSQVMADSTDGRVWLHQLRRQSDEVELARARTVWQRR